MVLPEMELDDDMPALAGRSVGINSSTVAEAPAVDLPAMAAISSGEQYRIIALAYQNVVNAQALRRRWIPDKGLLKLIKQRYNFDKCFNVDVGDLNHAISIKFPMIEAGHAMNDTGHYRMAHRVTYQNDDGRKIIRQHMKLYYKTELEERSGELPSSADKKGWEKLYLDGMKIIDAEIEQG